MNSDQLSDQRLESVLKTAYLRGKEVTGKGTVATYIPELGKARQDAVGLCILTKDGKIFKTGDSNIRFTMQSVSKLLSLAMALEIRGYDTVFEHVGMEPSGVAFNSIVELDTREKPHNPLINAGAIAVESLLIEYKQFEDMLNFARTVCIDPEITLNRQVYNSEMATCDRNRAIAYLLKSKNVIHTNVETSIELYTKICSINVSAESLANFAMVLGSGGINPYNGERLLKESTAQTVKSIMFTCGMYDGSGTFAVEVGIPTKSGVGGGLLSVVDKHMGIGVYGPSLDENGNSIAGITALKYLSKELELHMFA